MKFVLVVVVVGALVYLTVRIIERRGLKPLNRPHRPQPRPLAPDDDPDFLWGLDKKKRHPEDDEGPDDKT